MSVADHDLPASSAAAPVRQSVKFTAGHGWQAVHLREIWQHRELLWILAVRDIKVRYKQTILGVTWAVVQPLATAVIFTVVLSRLGQIPTDNLPAPLFYFCGNLIWQVFSTALGRAGGSLSGSAMLITKVYFPRLILPVASIVSGLVDFGVGFVVLLAIMLFYRHHFQWSPSILLFPLFVLMMLLAALGAGLWFAALNVRYRDAGFILPFVMQIWMWITPVPYSIRSVPNRLRWLVNINPLSGPVEGFRWAMVGHADFPARPLAFSVAVILLVLTGGLFVFQRGERAMADIIQPRVMDE